ncbi:DUF488 domain-containing protein [Georgenia satyanarayanai]|uniref:DUF488 domain-containing protein n=1 Tax=Georgenia satyanarayanai TaxID=860221 RepID=UPI000DA18CF6|nr:DUF488 domain-containing protein [Georgenia satyanarayanai]
MPLLTVGHGALERAGLSSLLTGRRVGTVVDIRRFPGSRRNPDVARDALSEWLPDAGVAYRWEPRLGGRRHLRKSEDAASPDTWWQVDAFRAYAGYTRTEEFTAALAEVAEEARGDARVAVMCSEAVWWRCHRRLVADVATLLLDLPVHHLMHDGEVRLHEPSPGARVGDGVVVWDADAGVSGQRRS